MNKRGRKTRRERGPVNTRGTRPKAWCLQVPAPCKLADGVHGDSQDIFENTPQRIAARLTREGASAPAPDGRSPEDIFRKDDETK